jgi:integrase
MSKVQLPNLSCFIDRHGKPRWRVRKDGRTKSLIGKPGDTGFLDQYQAALNELAGKTPEKLARIPAGTVSHLLANYYGSSDWQELKASTKATYRGILERFRKDFGDLPYARLDRIYVQRMLDKMRDRPQAANNLVKVLKAVFKFAVVRGLVNSNPATGVQKLKGNTDGFPPWTLEDCAAYEQHHQPGTLARLAYELLRHTGARRSDVVRMGWSNITEEVLTYRQEKTGVVVDIPLAPSLAAELALHRVKALTFLAVANGQMRSVKAFGGWFQDHIQAAGIKGRSAHGLRKRLAIDMANVGCTPHQIAAITGHQTLKEVERYTKGFSRKGAAFEAHAKLYGAPRQEEKANA